MKKEKKQVWIITVGGCYGSFEFKGTEAQAELRRKQKAVWEGEIATKMLKKSERTK